MIKSTIENCKESNADFPKLMQGINQDCIVLFLNPREGIKLHGLNNEFLFTVASWPIENFSDFNHELILSNERVKQND